MHQIDFTSRVAGKSQAAFVIFYSLTGQPWQGYPGATTERASLVIPTCLMMHRTDGRLGFIGGRAEAGESLEAAAGREVLEEIGYAHTAPLAPLAAHDIGSITTHAFTCELTYPELVELVRNGSAAPHFGSEVAGLFLPHLINFDEHSGARGGLTNLLRSPMPPSVREELAIFLRDVAVIDGEMLRQSCSEAGFSLDVLVR